MRLCWNDGFGRPLGKFTLEDAKFYRDIGFGVVGVNPGGSLEATDEEVERVKRIYAEAGLMPGPMPIGLSLVKPDPAEMEIEKKKLARALQLAGKLGCPAIQPSVGSLNPKSIWHYSKDNASPRAMDLLVKYTRELIPVAEDNNCIISPETTQWTIARSIPTMQEFVDRCGSPYVRVTFDFVNHMNAERIYDTGRYIRCAVGTLGDRIGIFHVKDVQVQEDALLVLHLNEAPMGTGLLDQEALIRASTAMEPWKTFSLEHIRTREALKPAYDHIQSIATGIGHKWTDPKVTHTSYLKKSGR
jgi:sugar phosphate isomerase/epimerase